MQPMFCLHRIQSDIKAGHVYHFAQIMRVVVSQYPEVVHLVSKLVDCRESCVDEDCAS